jgi:hypothetical protein
MKNKKVEKTEAKPKRKASPAPAAAEAEQSNGRDVKPVWRKVTRGKLSLTRKGAAIKPLQEVQLSAEELGKFKDQFQLVKNGTGKYAVDEPVSDTGALRKLKDVPKKPAEDKETYNIKGIEGSDFFNVVSSSGKQMNEEPLTETEAEELADSLDAESYGAE